MSGFWQVSGTTTATANNGASASAGGQEVRLRALEVVGSGTSAALTVTDSVGPTVIWSMTLPASAVLQLAGLDIRTVGNMTIAQTGGVSINAQGDFVSTGYPWGLT